MRECTASNKGLIPDTADYEALVAWLVTHESFSRVRRNAFCLHYDPGAGQESVPVDLMPFGAIADEAGDVHFVLTL